MTRGHDHPAYGAQFAHRPRQLRGGTQFGINPSFKSIGGEDFRRDLGKLLASVSAVARHSHAPWGVRGRFAMNLLQVIGKALRRVGDGGGVDPVRAGPHLSAQSTCSKRQIGIKRVNQSLTRLFVLFAGVQPATHRGARFIVMRGLRPRFGLGTHVVQETVIFHRDAKVHTSISTTGLFQGPNLR